MQFLSFVSSSFLELKTLEIITTILFLSVNKVYYEASARELVRINGTTKAPVVNYAMETSAGVVTIRAFKMADRFFQTFLHLVDTDAALFLHTSAAMEWLLARIELLQNLIFFAAASLYVFLPKGSIAPGDIKIMILYSIFCVQLRPGFIGF